MFGTNPIRPPEAGDGNSLQVQAVFPTLQGEGPHAGVPAVFIRLGGCNLACSFCDTEFESFKPMGLFELLMQVDNFSRGEGKMRVRHLIVITGGEPLRQNIEPLCDALVEQGFTVQLETNGTLMRPLPKEVHLVCSPKNTGQGYKPIRADVLERAIALKFIISAHDPLYQGIAEVGQTEHHVPVYVQPMDEHDAEKNARNLAFTAELAQRYGYRMSVQLHKILGIE